MANRNVLKQFRKKYFRVLGPSLFSQQARTRMAYKNKIVLLLLRFLFVRNVFCSGSLFFLFFFFLLLLSINFINRKYNKCTDGKLRVEIFLIQKKSEIRNLSKMRKNEKRKRSDILWKINPFFFCFIITFRTKMCNFFHIISWLRLIVLLNSNLKTRLQSDLFIWLFVQMWRFFCEIS